MSYEIEDTEIRIIGADNPTQNKRKEINLFPNKTIWRIILLSILLLIICLNITVLFAVNKLQSVNNEKIICQDEFLIKESPNNFESGVRIYVPINISPDLKINYKCIGDSGVVILIK